MTTIDKVSSTLSQADHRAQLCRAVIASTVGTTIEWYEFFLYGKVTGLVFCKLFFPRSDRLVGVLQAFAIYAVGFVARPVGAAIFGHYRDRIGRKVALMTTLLLTGIATFAVGFVAAYEQVGIWGAVEWGGSVLLSMEWARSNARRGFIASNSARRPGFRCEFGGVDVQRDLRRPVSPLGWHVPFFVCLPAST